MTRPLMAILPTLKGALLPNGKARLHGRFVSGMEETKRAWDGDLLTILEPLGEAEANAPMSGDDVEVDPRDFDWQIGVMDYGSPELKPALAKADLIHAGLWHRTCHIAQVAREMKKACTYGTEYSLRTRIQIVQAEVRNPVIAARRILWNVNLERKQRAAIKAADGVQCAGTPTFEAYRDISPNALLFFDGRLGREMVVEPEALEKRLAYLKEWRPLRIVYSGRLIKMKGADHLVEVGRLLEEQKVQFELHIYGTGDLVPAMERKIQRWDMGHRVKLMGYMPYDELMAKAKRDYDLFLCCHPQGDPSGAYIETLGNGLPIVGYANEAVSGMLALGHFGQLAPIGDSPQVARIIAQLGRDREPLAQWARAAAQFAREHTVDQEFAKRGQHYQEVLEAHRRGVRA